MHDKTETKIQAQLLLMRKKKVKVINFYILLLMVQKAKKVNFYKEWFCAEPTCALSYTWLHVLLLEEWVYNFGIINTAVAAGIDMWNKAKLW